MFCNYIILLFDETKLVIVIIIILILQLFVHACVRQESITGSNLTSVKKTRFLCITEL